MSALEVVLVVIAAFGFVGILVWYSYRSDLAWRRTLVRRERLRAEVELQRLTHLAVLRMLAVAREHHRPKP